MSEPEVLDQLLVARGFFERVEFLPVEVLDQGLLQAFPSEALRMMAGMVSRPALRAARQRLSPAMSSYSLSPSLAHQDRLQNPDLTNGCRQRGEGVLVEMVPRLTRVWADGADRQLRRAPLSLRVSVGINALKPLPNPLRRATTYLLG